MRPIIRKSIYIFIRGDLQRKNATADPYQMIFQLEIKAVLEETSNAIHRKLEYEALNIRIK